MSRGKEKNFSCSQAREKIFSSLYISGVNGIIAARPSGIKICANRDAETGHRERTSPKRRGPAARAEARKQSEAVRRATRTDGGRPERDDRSDSSRKKNDLGKFSDKKPLTFMHV